MSIDPRSRPLNTLLDEILRQTYGSEALDIRIYAALFGKPGPYGFQTHQPDYEFEDLDPYQPGAPWILRCPKFTAFVENAELLIPGYHFSGVWRVEARACAKAYSVSINNETRRLTGRTLPLSICAAAVAYYADHPDELNLRT